MTSFPLLTAEELKRHLQEERVRGIALDIDDTLSFTDNHWIEQMLEKGGNPENLTRDELLTKYGSFHGVPYWREPYALAVMRGFFHSAEFHDAIPLIDGADECVRRLARIVPIAAYITARPPTVHEATRVWLKRHSFPEAPIVCRPESTYLHARNAWKAGVLHGLYPEVTGIVDDHPELQPQLAALGYQGKAYTYANGQTRYDYGGVEHARSWDEVLERVARDTG